MLHSQYSWESQRMILCERRKTLLLWRVSDIGEPDSKYEEILGIPSQFFHLYFTFYGYARGMYARGTIFNKKASMW